MCQRDNPGLDYGRPIEGRHLFVDVKAPRFDGASRGVCPEVMYNPTLALDLL